MPVIEDACSCPCVSHTLYSKMVKNDCSLQAVLFWFTNLCGIMPCSCVAKAYEYLVEWFQRGQICQDTFAILISNVMRRHIPIKMSIHCQSLDGMSSLQCQRSVRPQFVESKDEKKAANLPARWHLQSLLAISSLPRLDRSMASPARFLHHD